MLLGENLSWSFLKVEVNSNETSLLSNQQRSSGTRSRSSTRAASSDRSSSANRSTTSSAALDHHHQAVNNTTDLHSMSLDDPTLTYQQREEKIKYLKHVLLKFMSCEQSEVCQ